MKRVCAILLVLIFLLVGCTLPSQEPPPLPLSETAPAEPQEGVHTEDSIDYEVIPDLAYAEISGVDPNLTSLDIYLPKSDQNHPIVIYFHGGAWRGGDKKEVGYKPEAFTGKGYTFISVNYRLSPEVQHPVHVQDVAKAIAWVYQNAAIYQSDPNRIFLMGHSAGAHLAALVATDGRYLEAEGLTFSLLKGIILLDGGGYDIPRIIEFHQLLYGRVYTIPFGEDPVVWRDASPITHVAEGKGIPPFLIIYVGNREISRLKAEWLSQALQEAEVATKVLGASDKTHDSLDQELGKPGDEITKQVFDFLSGHLQHQ